MEATAQQVDANNRLTQMLVDGGFMQVNEYGEASLTEKGRQRAIKRLDKLPIGDEPLISLYVLERFGVAASV